MRTHPCVSHCLIRGSGMTGLLRATLPLEGLVGRALLRMGNGPHGGRVAVKGSTVPTSKAPQILPESLTAHGHRVQTAKGTRSNTELKTSARSARPAHAFLPGLRAHVHHRPNKEAFHGSSQSGFSLGGILGVKVTLPKLLSLSARGKGAAQAAAAAPALGTVWLQGR